MIHSDKRKIVKIIGIPGSGKSFLLEKLRKVLPMEFNFIEFGQEVEKRAVKAIHKEGTKNKSNAELLIEEIMSYDTPTILTYHLVRRDGKKYEKDLWLEEMMNGVGYVYIYAKPEDVLKRRITDKENNTRIRGIDNIKKIQEHDDLVRKNMIELQKKLGFMYLEIENNNDNVIVNINKVKNFIGKALSI